MRYEHVFGDLRAFAQCHAATIVRRSDGGHFVAWFGGTHEGNADTAIWACERDPDAKTGSFTNAVRWSEPRVIAKVSDLAHWNPVLFQISPDEFVLHFKVGRQIRNWTTWVQRSHDAGRNWEAARLLVRGGRGGRGAVKNKPIELRSGEWLAGASTESWRNWDAFVDRSPNGLDDWQASPTFPIDRSQLRGKGIIQPTLWQSSDDDVHALLRSTEGMLYRTDSDDGGFHWSKVEPTSLPNNNSGVDIVRIRNGTLALACNPVIGSGGSRTPLSILFSADNGKSWPTHLELETGPGEFSYPALIEDGDGICVAFTWNRRRIAVAWIDPQEIPAR